MDKFSLGDGEADTQSGPFGLQRRVSFLQYLYVPAVGRRCNRETEGVNVGEGEALGDLRVETGDVNDEEEGGDRGPLGGTHRDWGKDLW